MFETVVIEQPARAATSRSVGLPRIVSDSIACYGNASKKASLRMFRLPSLAMEAFPRESIIAHNSRGCQGVNAL
jgi:hypothetical protein